MPDPIDPPRPSLRSGVRTFLAGCSWSTPNQRVEDANGAQIHAWLNQTGNPGITVTVQWDAGTSTQAGAAIKTTIPNDSFTIIKNGTYDQQTGVMTYNGKTYRFACEVVGGVATMRAYNV